MNNAITLITTRIKLFTSVNTIVILYINIYIYIYIYIYMFVCVCLYEELSILGIQLIQKQFNQIMLMNALKRITVSLSIMKM